MRTISTLLIANRGEIACRVIRTAKSLGIRTVAVYSTADAGALHVREADVAWPIGDAPVAASYLNIDAIIEAAKATHADAIHPGYGFLSENATFGAACEAAGLVFIGPSSQAIEVMGDKARAKRAMIDAGVPCVPGYQGEDQDVDTLCAEAKRIGMPVMVKAAAGGGGRGMRLVDDPAQLTRAIELAQSEAENAFGSRELIIEKAIVEPRHVEIQVFADTHGHVVYLGERDCSIQRRHQKVVEEAPCPVMTPELRAAMGEAAVNAAKAVNYVGAGTVEFLLDANREFYFLEMNTRLQVEHPVTELITGFDLVEWQIRVARGEVLPALQQDIKLEGHAIEVRLYAEDPAQGFLPATGPVHYFAVPESAGVRVDTGIASGDEVSPYYDAMVAKIMAAGANREDARNRLLLALSETALFGVANNRDFLIDVLKQPTFIAGEATTAFIGDLYGDSFERSAPTSRELAAGAVIQHGLAQANHQLSAVSVSDELLDWCSSDDLFFDRCYRVGEDEQVVRLKPIAGGGYEVACQGNWHSVSLVEVDDATVTLEVDGLSERFVFTEVDQTTLWLASNNRTLALTDEMLLPPESAEAAAGGTVMAPMHGLLLSVDVSVGDRVEQGQRLAVLEAMKMQHEIKASVAGVVGEIAAAPGQQLGAGDLMLQIEEQS
ncbi:MAG: acetyl-CoA carboxylase biotin carboxylase subunit [Halieaceae bacterium]|jgi:geranyl-CoA carboxylase alpha subunit|nr:acetyl-CoA carboxylase biotin carboxylase subunit [Halieaceae bacterium]